MRCCWWQLNGGAIVQLEQSGHHVGADQPIVRRAVRVPSHAHRRRQCERFINDELTRLHRLHLKHKMRRRLHLVLEIAIDPEPLRRCGCVALQISRHRYRTAAASLAPEPSKRVSSSFHERIDLLASAFTCEQCSATVARSWRLRPVKTSVGALSTRPNCSATQPKDRSVKAATVVICGEFMAALSARFWGMANCRRDASLCP